MKNGKQVGQGIAHKQPRTANEQGVLDFLMKSGPRPLQDLVSANAGTFGQTVLAVESLQRDGLVTILSNGRIATVGTRRHHE